MKELIKKYKKNLKKNKNCLNERIVILENMQLEINKELAEISYQQRNKTLCECFKGIGEAYNEFLK